MSEHLPRSNTTMSKAMLELKQAGIHIFYISALGIIRYFPNGSLNGSDSAAF